MIKALAGASTRLSFFLLLLGAPLAFATGGGEPASAPSQASGEEVQVSIRDKMDKCGAYLTPLDPMRADGKLYDSVGLPISQSSTPEETRANLEAIVAKKGASFLKESALFVTGIEMQNEDRVKAEYEAMLTEMGLKEQNIQVRILSIPRKMFEGNARQILASLLTKTPYQALWQRAQYFLINKNRDYQEPIKAEQISNIVSQIPVEVGTVVFLFGSLRTDVAAVTAITHATILWAYAKYNATLLNWLLRPGVTTPERFTKQMMMSVPFIVNFNVVTKYPEIYDFISKNGVEAALQAFPEQLVTFAATQGLTTLLQTVFYQVVVTNGVRAWGRSLSGEDNELARTKVVAWDLVPFLTLDSIFLSMASSNYRPAADAFYSPVSEPIVRSLDAANQFLDTAHTYLPGFMDSATQGLGAIELNLGHALLFGTTVAFGTLMKMKPDLLNPTLNWYRGYERAMKNFQGWVKTNTGIDLTKNPFKSGKNESKPKSPPTAGIAFLEFAKIA